MAQPSPSSPPPRIAWVADFPFGAAQPPAVSLGGHPDRPADGEARIVDRTTLDRLVRAHLPAALRFATRLTGDADAAEDVVQDALARVGRSWMAFRGEATFRTWLFGIVVNAFRDRLDARRRSDRREPRGAGDAPADDIPDSAAVDPAAAAAAGELGERVAAIVSSLPPRQREVLVMVAYEQMTITDVAAALATNEQNVRANLHAARERVRARLAPYLAEDRRER